MTKDEALKLALEALEKSHTCPLLPDDCAEAITAIKEALMSGTDGAQPEPWEKFCDSNCVWTDHHPDCKLAEQEPVAWATRMGEYAHIHWGAKRPEYPMVYEVPLYTTPPQRKPLSDEEIKAMYIEKNWYEMAHAFTWGAAEVVARAIEAAHGIYAPTELKGEA